jgi:hypothetical protein
MTDIWRCIAEWLSYLVPAINNALLFLVGVALSFPAIAENIENNSKRAKTVAGVCIILGIVGFVI